MTVALASDESSSSAALTATVRAVLQSFAAKRSEVWLPAVFESVSTVTSALSLESATLTGPVGSVASRTVKESVEPSEIVNALADTKMPGAPSSVTVTATCALATLP